MWHIFCFIVYLFDFAPYRYAHHVIATRNTGKLLMFDDVRERRINVKPGWFILKFHDGAKAAITPEEFSRLYIPFAGDEYISKVTFLAHECMNYGEIDGEQYRPGDRIIYVWSDCKMHRTIMERAKFMDMFVLKAF